MIISGNTPYQVSGQLRPNTLLTWYEQEKRRQAAQSDPDSPPFTFTVHDTVEISGGYKPYTEPVPLVCNYEKRGDAGLLVIYDSRELSCYLQRLFRISTEKLNEMIGNGSVVRAGQTNGRDSFTVELAAARYEELRGQIMAAFGDDEALRGTYLETLDKAFLFELHCNAVSAAQYLEYEQEHERWAQNTGNELLYRPHALAIHKDFNTNKFLANTMDLMKQFAQAFFQKVKDGAASAWELTVEYLMRSTETASVNKLSFGDFMIFEQSRWSAATTKEEDIAARNSNHAAFLSNPNLSGYLKSVLK